MNKDQKIELLVMILGTQQLTINNQQRKYHQPTFVSAIYLYQTKKK